MKAMILAAGHGKRMMPITETTPKPLLEVDGKCLIEYHLERIVQAGIREVAINISHLRAMIRDRLGDGSAYGLHITYCDEGDQILNTGGGIINALPYLGDDTFLVINADIFTDYAVEAANLSPGCAQLIMIDNPDYHADGDFYVDGTHIAATSDQRLTFAGIGYYTPEFFAGIDAPRPMLRDIIDQRIATRKVSYQKFDGQWFDVGTPQRLEEIQSL